MKTFEDIVKVKEEVEGELLRKRNVVAVGVGYKVRKGKVTKTLCIKVYVSKKLPRAMLADEDVVPARVKDVPTDVVEVGELKALSFLRLSQRDRKGRFDPLLAGVSIGHYKITAGTLGAIVFDEETNEPLLLSNNHVFANCDSKQHSRAKEGDDILQSGPYDGGTRANDVTAKLLRWVKLDESGDNEIDAALARPTRNALYSILWTGNPETISVFDVGDVKLGDEVWKSGRTTGVNRGTVIDLEVTAKVSYGSFVATFKHLIATSKMLEGGDSGSLLVKKEGGKWVAVGLGFAGSEVVSLYCPIRKVMKALKFKFSPIPKRRYAPCEGEEKALSVSGLRKSKIEWSFDKDPPNYSPNEYATISGRLVDAVTGEGIPAREIIIRYRVPDTGEKGEISSITDAKGNFSTMLFIKEEWDGKKVYVQPVFLGDK